MLVFWWLNGIDKTLAFIIAIPGTALFAMYNIYFNARFGGTLGKLAMSIRVTKPDGARIGWPEAFKRSAVGLIFAFVSLCIQLWALAHVDAAQYAAATGFFGHVRLRQAYYPSWFSTVRFLQQVWIWSELVVLLLNQRKRALHDFIAGTVVAHARFTQYTPGECPVSPDSPQFR